MSEENNEFTLQKWIETPAEAYSLTDSQRQELVTAARVFADTCVKLGVPGGAYAQVGQSDDGEFSLLLEGECASVARVGSPILLANLILSGDTDPVGAAMAVLNGHHAKFSNNE